MPTVQDVARGRKRQIGWPRKASRLDENTSRVTNEPGFLLEVVAAVNAHAQREVDCLWLLAAIDNDLVRAFVANPVAIDLAPVILVERHRAPPCNRKASDQMLAHEMPGSHAVIVALNQFI
jgi:hypothetical protein